LKGLERSAQPSTFEEWSNRIVRTAKEICNDPDCKRIKLTQIGIGDVPYSFADKEAIDCVIKSIQTHLNSMPYVQQELFRKSIPELEKQKTRFKT
jgi:hypothetical protein